MTRPLLLVCLACGAAAAADAPPAERPLSQMPYTPSLDLSAMDRSANPCVDFYAFSCGGWQRNNPLPPDQAGWSVYAKLQTDTLKYLWGVLEEAAKPQPTRDAVTKQVGDFFAACMDEAAVEKLMESGIPRMEALKAVARQRGLSKREVYRMVNGL